MLYKFKCKTAGDVLMLGPQGDQLLRLMGREPAPRGIIEPISMPAAILALQRAAQDNAATPANDDLEDPAGSSHTVNLKQRVWPMIEMMRLAHPANEPIVWGV